MPPIRINLRDIDELDDLDETLDYLEEQENQRKRIRSRDRTDSRKPPSDEVLERKRDERRRNKEFTRYMRQQRYQ